jgi:glycosyltransferase involved in cell wall biosynthesis
MSMGARGSLVRRLRILQFITPTGFYGAERWVLALARNLDHRQVVCDLAVTREGRLQDLSVADQYPGKVHYLSMRGPFDFRVMHQLSDVVRRRKIDVIHSHGYKSDILGWLTARRTGIKCISTPHGFPGNVGFKLAAYMRLGGLALRLFDMVAPLSDELRNDLKRMKVPPHRTRLIRNAVDLKEIDIILQRMRVGVNVSGTGRSRPLTVGFIGQMIPRKGIPDLLEVFDRLHAGDSAVRLRIVGEGWQRRALEKRAAQLSAGRAVEFLGFRSDRLELLAGFDVFVMTSGLEGIPRCLMEAMAMGVPIVAYDIPGIDELIEHRRTGLLASYGNKEELLARCREILDDPELASGLARAARNRVETHFSAGRMAREYENAYRELLDRV